MYTIWQASHQDQSYYCCSDMIFSRRYQPPGAHLPVFARSAEIGEISRHLAGSRVKELSVIDEIDPEKRPAHARDCLRP